MLGTQVLQTVLTFKYSQMEIPGNSRIVFQTVSRQNPFF